MNVCSCTIHANIQLAVDALHNSNKILNQNIKYSNSVFDEIICPDPTKSCYENKCPDCKNGSMFQKFIKYDDNLQNEVSWFEWVRVSHTKSAEKTTETIPEKLGN
jgi:hypothetical protein